MSRNRVQRVFATGVGAVSPLGVGADLLWSRCCNGESVQEPIPAVWNQDFATRSQSWAPLPDIDHQRYGLIHNETLQHDPGTLIAFIAASEALHSAGFELCLTDKKTNRFKIEGLDSQRCAVSVGTGVGGIHSLLALHSTLVLKPRVAELSALPPTAGIAEITERMLHPTRVNPFTISMVMPNASAAAIGIKYNFEGPNDTFTQACAAGSYAIGRAYQAIARGDIDLCLAGGVEWMHAHDGTVFHAWDRTGTLLRATDDNPQALNRPFDSARSGMLFAQGGAGIVVLESERHYSKRHRTPIAEVCGFGESFDAYSLMSPEPNGRAVESAMRTALADAGAGAAEIGYINAHGTGTHSNDQGEAEAISRVFGDQVPVNSTKGLVGHTLAASGALEFIVTAKTMADGRAHPCNALQDPISSINLIRETKAITGEYGLTQSFGFGGHNAVIVLRSIGN